MKRMHSMSRIAVAAALACTAPFALAQTPPARQAMQQDAMGQHDMTGTVESVNAKGMVDVRTAVGTLRVHFPGASRELKKGEKITLHLSYTAAPASSSSM